jgi:predicted XRE-type DNA-binding protein
MAIKKKTKRKMTKKDIQHRDEILEEIELREEKGELLGSTSDDFYSSPVDLFKRGICKEIASVKARNNLTSKRMAELMNVDKSKSSLIINGRVENFSIDRLLGCFLGLKNIEKETDKKIEEVFSLFSSDKEAV